jgi:hypothetical protein
MIHGGPIGSVKRSERACIPHYLAERAQLDN